MPARYAIPVTTPDEPETSELLVRAAHRLRRRWMASMEPWNVSPHEFRALDAAIAGEGARLSDIAERLRIAPRSATEVVDTLESKGLVRRVPSPTDRRAVLVEPTPEGAALASEIAHRRAAVGAQMLEPLTSEEGAQLRALLLRVLADETGAAHRHGPR